MTHAAPSKEWTGAVEQGRQIVRAHLTEKNLPGSRVAVGAAGEIVWAEGFGWADLDNRVKVAPDMRFRIGTASTALTSAAVGLLLENGRLKLDEVIQTYVPAFPKKQWPVTLRQLMGHVAGVRNDGGDEGPLLSERCERPVEALRFFADSSLRFEPGTQYRYSSYGWILVSAAVEAAADERFFTFMRKQIFEPLNMKNTRDDFTTNRVTSYFPRFAADPRYGLDLNRPIELSCYSGSSAIMSTPSDLVRFAMAINSGKLLQPATVQSLQTSQRLTSGEETGYGLGWDLETVPLSGKQARLVGHGGDILARNGGVVHDVPRARDRRVRHVEHLVCGHLRSCRENRGPLRYSRRIAAIASSRVAARAGMKNASREIRRSIADIAAKNGRRRSTRRTITFLSLG